jgi:hypothetical protein
MHSAQKAVLALRTSCVKHVHVLRIPAVLPPKLSTVPAVNHKTKWTNNQVTHHPLHTFSMQFYPNKKSKITEASDTLSTLSTPLIIKRTELTKENLLIGSGG